MQSSFAFHWWSCGQQAAISTRHLWPSVKLCQARLLGWQSYLELHQWHWYSSSLTLLVYLSGQHSLKLRQLVMYWYVTQFRSLNPLLASQLSYWLSFQAVGSCHQTLAPLQLHCQALLSCQHDATLENWAQKSQRPQSPRSNRHCCGTCHRGSLSLGSPYHLLLPRYCFEGLSGVGAWPKALWPQSHSGN